MIVKYFNDMGFRKTIKKPESKENKVCFENFTNLSISTLSKNFFLNEKYYYELNDAVILGSRSCLKDDQLFMDLPIEWGLAQIGSYINRVKQTHKNREFKFLSDVDCERAGYATLELNRSCMKILEPSVFVGSVESWNFGFFSSVILSKIFIADQIFPELPVIVPITKTWQIEMLKYFFPNKKYVFYDPEQNIDVSNIKVIGWPNFPFYLDEKFIEAVRAKNEMRCPFFPGRKIFFSRRKFKGGKDRVVFSSREEELLLRKGYMPLYPEELNLQTLHKIISSCSHIALESGSALFNGILSKSNAEIILFESRSEFLNNHAMYLSSVTDRAKIYFCDESSIFNAIESI